MGLSEGNSSVDADLPLVQRCQKGDLSAFEILVLRYQKPISRLVYRIVGQEEVVEDLVQDIFLKAFYMIKSFQRKARFSTWLYRLAVNTCLDYFKPKREFLSWDGMPADEEQTYLQQIERRLSLATATPEVNLSRKEMVQKLQEALDCLTPEDKTVVILRDLLGHSYQEIAEIMDWPLGTVRTRLFRARRSLQALMRQYVETESEQQQR